ncbi:MAG TPA: hypothetical protein VF192_14945 [Longimicrobiales bacterium]
MGLRALLGIVVTLGLALVIGCEAEDPLAPEEVAGTYVLERVGEDPFAGCAL